MWLAKRGLKCSQWQALSVSGEARCQAWEDATQQRPKGEIVLPFMGYISICDYKGYGFSAVLIRNGSNFFSSFSIGTSTNAFNIRVNKGTDQKTTLVLNSIRVLRSKPHTHTRFLHSQETYHTLVYQSRLCKATVLLLYNCTKNHPTSHMTIPNENTSTFSLYVIPENINTVK